MRTIEEGPSTGHLGLGYDAPPWHEGPDGHIRTEALADLPPDRRAAVERLDKLATLLDSQFSVLGIRFGLDPILGLVPVAGDVASGLISAYLILEAARAGARKRDVGHMVVNVALDTAIGSIPILGSIFDVAYKPNNRNVRILRRTLTGGGPAEPPRRG